MTDITERLRRWTHDVNAVPASDLMDDAAAVIEGLRWKAMTTASAAKHERERGRRRWISVEERLPERGDTIWGFDSDGVGLCEFGGGSFQSYGASCDTEGLHSETLTGITHWMELQCPEPPEVTK